MFFNKYRRELELLKAFQALFFDKNHHLKPEAEKVIAFFRDEAGARGELGHFGKPYLYDANNRFDVHAAAFLLGKRRMFDLLIKYLALDERAVFKLQMAAEKNDDNLQEQLEV